MKTFSTLYLGTAEISLEIYEVSRGKGLKRLDRLSKSHQLAPEIVSQGRISTKGAARLLSLVEDCLRAAAGFGAEIVRFDVQETMVSAENLPFVLDRIRQKSGLEPQVLSNAEQCYFGYAAAASRPEFSDQVSELAILADLSGEGLQLTLFSGGAAEATQHLLFGTATVARQLSDLARKSDRREQVREILRKQLDNFQNLYVQGRCVRRLLLLGSQVTLALRYLGRGAESASLEAADYRSMIDTVDWTEAERLLSASGYAQERALLLEAFLLIQSAILETFSPEWVDLPGATVNEGIAIDYAVSAKAIRSVWDFDADVRSAAWALSRRYGSYQPHLEAMASLVTLIFDAIKKHHGLPKRDRLLLEAAAILHDCGKYISIAHSAACSQQIILSTEILGLTRRERVLVASVVAANRERPEGDLQGELRLSAEEQVRMAKMLSILRLAAALDRSHKQKFKKLSASVREGQLLIVFETKGSISIEKGDFEDRADRFEEIYGIRPVIRERRGSMVEVRKKT